MASSRWKAGLGRLLPPRPASRLPGPWREADPHGGWEGFACSVRGDAHVRLGAPNQDAGGVRALPRNAGVVLAVADGHGDRRHARSDRGARIAVDIALDVIGQWIVRHAAEATPAPVPSGAEISRRILTRWQEAVDADLAADPPLGEIGGLSGDGQEAATGPELYGTTLLAAALTPSYAFYLMIGDGDMVAVESDGNARHVVPRQPDLPRNRSDSLCHRDALVRIRTRAERFDQVPPPALVLLSTDGYANSYASDEAFLGMVGGLHASVGERGFGWTCERIEGWLTKTSAAGSGDDITVALAWNSSARSARPLESAIPVGDSATAIKPARTPDPVTAMKPAPARNDVAAIHDRPGVTRAPGWPGPKPPRTVAIALVGLVVVVATVAGVASRGLQDVDDPGPDESAVTRDVGADVPLPAADEDAESVDTTAESS